MSTLEKNDRCDRTALIQPGFHDNLGQAEVRIDGTDRYRRGQIGRDREIDPFRLFDDNLRLQILKHLNAVRKPLFKRGTVPRWHEYKTIRIEPRPRAPLVE